MRRSAVGFTVVNHQCQRERSVREPVAVERRARHVLPDHLQPDFIDQVYVLLAPRRAHIGPPQVGIVADEVNGTIPLIGTSGG